MIPVEIMGHSFKGVVSYLAQGKKGSKGGSEKRRMIYTKNMEDFAPRSWKEVYAIMARYAFEDVRRGLMQAGNVRGCAREINKDKPPVRHIILAFPPGADPKPKFVRVAVHEALSSLESINGRTLVDHQYAVFLHEDTDNWHVHIVVNMVDHRTGRLADPYRSQQKLQRWAYDWCKRHDFDVCKSRQIKYDRIERKSKAANSAGERYKDYASYQNFRGDRYHLRQLKRKRGAGKQGGLSANISREALEMKAWCQKRYETRRQEWQDLDRDIKMQYRATAKAYKKSIDDAVKLETDPLLLTLHWWQKRERQYFFWRERYAVGRLANALLYAGYMGGDSYGKNLLHLLLNPQSRRLAMFRQQYAERAQSPKVQRMKRQRDAALSKLNAESQTRKDVLKADHLSQRGVEIWEWKILNYKRYQSGMVQRNANGAGEIRKERLKNMNKNDEPLFGIQVDASFPLMRLK